METTLRWLLALVAAAVLAACGPDDLLGNQGRIRLVNATHGLGALDLLVKGDAVIVGVPSASVSDYVLRKADTYQLDVRETDNAAILLTTSTNLVADKHQTLVAYNSGGAVAATILNDEEGNPGHNKAKLRIFNTATSDADKVDVYLITSACSSLAGSVAAPTATSVSGLQGSYVELAASATAYHVCVTTAGDRTDVRLEIPSFVLSDQRIVTIVLVLGPGGYLMNGLLLEQQGAATQALSPFARARVASSVATPVDVSVSGTPVVASLAQGGVGTYVLVPTGTVTLTVNGASVVPTAPLDAAPGADLTVLLTGTGSTATLVADDNTTSPNTLKPVKLRLVNGLNGATGTATLTLNNAPTGSGAAPGQASPYTQVASSAGLARIEAKIGTVTYYLDPAATLNAQGVYTLFLLGDAAPAPPNRGVLFPDR